MLNMKKKKVKKKVKKIKKDNYILSIWRSILAKFNYHDVPMNKKTKLYNGLVLPPTKHMYIFITTFFGLISSIYAISRKYYHLAIVPFGVFLTSVNYWRHPLYNSKRRYIDIIYVNLAMFYQIWYAYNSQYANLYYIILFITLCFVPLSWYYHNKNKIWIGTFLHSMIHILGNISNIILYSGKLG